MTRKILRIALLSLLMLLCYSGVGNPDAIAEMTEGGIRTMKIQSNAFKEGARIPTKHTCEGEDVSPQLSWEIAPAGTKSIALICDDPDAPVGTWVHWVLFNLSPDTTELPEGVPSDGEVLGGAKHGSNDFGNLGYGGPCPPPGPDHRYYFKLYALDTALSLDVGATKADVMQAIEGHVLAEGQLMGRYSR